MRVAVSPLASVARIVKVLAPSVVGVPATETWIDFAGVKPALGSTSSNPAGSAPEMISQRTGPRVSGPKVIVVVVSELSVKSAPTKPGPSSSLTGVIWLTVGPEVTVRTAPTRAPPASAMITVEVVETTVLVSIGNVACVAPAGTVTLGGTVAAFVLSLVSPTACPPEGAAEASFTVPVTAVPPTTSLELSVTLDAAGPVAAGVTASVKDFVTEPWEAVMSDDVLALTANVVTANEAVLAP